MKEDIKLMIFLALIKSWFGGSLAVEKYINYIR